METFSDNVYSYRSIDAVRRQRIDAGEKALTRIDKHVTFYDWHQTGIAIQEMHAECYERSGSPSPKGKGYNAVFRVLKAANPRLGNLEKGTRSCARWMAEHWSAAPEGTLDPAAPGVETWHASLTDEVRRLYNHPVVVKRQYLKKYPSTSTAKDAVDPYAPDRDTNDAEGDEDDYDGFGERIGADRQSAGSDEGAKSSAEKDLWLHSLREVWEQGEDEWRAEFIEEESAYVDVLDGIDDEVDRLRTDAINRDAGAVAGVRTGGISDEALGATVLDAADHIAAVHAGEMPPPAADEVFPASLGDNIGATGPELQKALKKPRRTRKAPPTPMTEEEYDRERARISAEFPEHMSKPDFDRLVGQAETRLGKDAVAAVKKAHRNARYRTDWAPILKELAAL